MLITVQPDPNCQLSLAQLSPSLFLHFNIFSHLFRVTYGAAKTKVTVVGSRVDVDYFHDVKPWVMDGKMVQVVEDNEHLGLVVSNDNQAQKNVDLKVQKGRSNIFTLLGSGYAYKSHLSPVLKLHLQ